MLSLHLTLEHVTFDAVAEHGVAIERTRLLDALTIILLGTVARSPNTTGRALIDISWVGDFLCLTFPQIGKDDLHPLDEIT